ncbi:MAG: tRNA-intron lyase [Halobacteriales archaeon]
MEGRTVDGAIRLPPEARQQFHEPRGVGRPTADGLELTWVEAAYLALRGDLTAVDGGDAADVLTSPPDDAALDRLLVYRDLRDRGYYLAPTYPPGTTPAPGAVALEVRPRGAEPTGDAVAHHVRVLREGASVAVEALEPGTLAIVDDEAEVTYLEVEAADPRDDQPPLEVAPVRGVLAGGRVLVGEPPAALHRRWFLGSTLGDDRLALSLPEAAYLAGADRLVIDGGAEAIAERGRAIEGASFDRRARVYASLRERGLVPRSGLKFGADFRVYGAIEDAAEPGHSRLLVEVVPADATLPVRSLSRAVRLATGVRKRHVVATVDADGDIAWRGVGRLTP